MNIKHMNLNNVAIFQVDIFNKFFFLCFVKFFCCFFEIFFVQFTSLCIKMKHMGYLANLKASSAA